MTKTRTLVVFLFIIALSLRLFSLGYESLWLDEASSYHGIQSDYVGVIKHCVKINQPPLYLLLLKLWKSIFGSSEIALRSLSVLFGLLSFIFLFLMLKRNFGLQTALWGGFIFAFSKFHIEFSQEVRNYNLLVLLSILVSYFLFEYLKSKRIKHFIFFTVFSVLILYTHIYGWFFVVAVDSFLLLLILKKQFSLKIAILYNLSLFLFFLPWLFVFIGQVVRFYSSGTWIPKPTLNLLLGTFANFSNNSFLLIFYFFLLLTAFFLFLKKYKGNLSRVMKIESDNLAFVFSLYTVLWLLVTLSLPLLISIFSTPIFIIRYSILSSTAFLILIALSLTFLTEVMFRKKDKILFVVVVALVIIFQSFYSYTDYFKIIYGKHKKEEWRETVKYLKQNSTGGGTILLNAGYIQYPFSYYYSGSDNVEMVNTIDDMVDFTNLLPMNLSLILSHNQYTDPKKKVEKYLLNHYNIVHETNYNYIKIYILRRK